MVEWASRASSSGAIQEHIRNADSWALLQTCQVRILGVAARLCTKVLQVAFLEVVRSDGIVDLLSLGQEA